MCGQTPAELMGLLAAPDRMAVQDFRYIARAAGVTYRYLMRMLEQPTTKLRGHSSVRFFDTLKDLLAYDLPDLELFRDDRNHGAIYVQVDTVRLPPPEQVSALEELRGIIELIDEGFLCTMLASRRKMQWERTINKIV